MRIGLYPISAKPYHLGHHMVIEKASKECEKVIVIVSLLDRENIMGSDMAIIWRDHILKILPANVSTIFLESSPVARVFEILKLREENPLSEYSFSIYSDEHDIMKNYNNDALKKVCPRLLMSNEVTRRGISRNETVAISGSELRNHILNVDFKSFKQGMPEQLDSLAIFNILATLHKEC